MNPQFQNLMGMGRGMPNGNMQQMQQPPPQQMNNTNNAMKLQQYIIQSLSQDGPFTGWQAEVPIAERAGRVKLLVDSLRLLGPAAVEMSRAVDVALNFERKEFAQQPSREDYHRECDDKLSKIRDQRQQAFKMQNMAVPNQAMLGGNPAFQQQLQQAQLQQLGRNPGMPQQGMQPNMQPSPVINQQFGQQNMVQNMNPLMNQMRLNMPQNPAQRPLSQEDNSKINQRAAALARNTPQEEMQAIIDNMDPGLKQNCESKNIDPIAYHFRIAAIREFRQRQLQAGAAAINQQRVNANPNGNFNAMGQMAGVQQNAVNPMLNQAQNQPNANPFLSNVDLLRDQQAAALRLQEEGQMVVPASSNNAAADQLRLQQQLAAGQQRGQQANPAMNPQFLAQQQMMKAGLNLQQQHKQRLNAAQQAPQQTPKQAPGQGIMQNTGQGQNPMQGLNQQQNNMNILNRPVEPAMPGTSPQPARPASRQPMPGQTPQLTQPQLTAAQIQHREGFLSQFPPQMQAILRSKPTTEWAAIVAKFKSAQNAPNNMNRSNSQQPQVGLQPGQQTALQFLNGPNAGPSPMQQSLSAGQVMNSQPPQMGNNAMPNVGQQPNPQMAANPELMRQRQLQMQQQHQARLAGQANQVNGTELPKKPLNPQEMAIMDQQPVHTGFLRQIQIFTQAQGNFLPEIKTWLQLKQWLAANPLPKLNMQSLLQVQATQFHAVRARQQLMPAQMPNASQNSSALPITAQQSQLQAQMLALNRPITDQDIQRVRAQHPRSQGFSDEQIRQGMLLKRKQLQENHAKAMMMQQPSRPPGQMQPAQIPQPMQQKSSQQGMMIPSQTPQMPNNPGIGQPQQIQTQNNAGVPRPGPARQMPQPQQVNLPPQVDQKNLKRPNDDGAGASTAQNRNTMAEQIKNMPNLTKEQFERLDPGRQRQYVDMRRRQEAVRKITELGRELQASMPPVRPVANMDANSKKRIIALLTSESTKNMLIRFDSFLVGYYLFEKDDVTLKQLMNQRNHLAAQYKQQAFANKTFEPSDQFSITAENVESIIANITQKFQQTSAKFGKAQQQSVPLTAENLSLAQAQAAQQQKKGPKVKDGPPPAPTGEKPPFPIGDSRGQGTPTYAPAPGLKQEDLKLDPKRRKKNPLANTAVAPSESPEIVKEQKVPVQTFRCTTVECQHQNRSFFNQAALEEHVKTIHQRPEAVPVTDAVAFLDNSLREVFDLDENFQPRLKIEQSQSAPLMQKTLSKAGSNLKVESKPSTPAAMVRGASQQTSKGGVPSTPTLLKTPQSTHEGVKIPGQKSVGTSREISSSWANSSVSLGQLSDTFGNFEWDSIVPGLDNEKVDSDNVLQVYMRGEEWQKIRSGGSSDGATDKSKSPDQGSDSNVPSSDTSALKQASQGNKIDLMIDGVDMAEGFEGLIMNDESQLQAASDGDVDWEFPTPPEADQVMVDNSNPFASDADPELAAWLNEPVTMSGFNDLGPGGFPDIDSMSPFEELNMDDWLQKPSVNFQQKITVR